MYDDLIEIPVIFCYNPYAIPVWRSNDFFKYRFWLISASRNNDIDWYDNTTTIASDRSLARSAAPRRERRFYVSQSGGQIAKLETSSR